MEPKPGMNTGVIINQPSPSDWIAGGETGIASVVVEASGQYDLYLPDEESQALFNPYNFDTFGCVSFSATNNLEVLINRLRAKGLLPATHEKFLQENGYINKQSGKVNFSDRFTAKLSNTTKAGNSLDAVGDSIRTLHGLLPESDWSFPNMDDIIGDNEAMWNRYYAEIPLALQTKARKFLDYFLIQRQWVALGSSTPAALRENLKQGPFQIATSICFPWASNEGMPPIQGCGCGAQHATIIYGFREENSWKVFDHYKSYKKLIAENYCIPWAVQYALTPKGLASPTPFHYVFLMNLRMGAPDTPEVRNLQRALQTLRRSNGQTYMRAGVFGPYGQQTKTALGQFQLDRGIVDPQGPGMNFGPKTRQVMNALLA